MAIMNSLKKIRASIRENPRLTRLRNELPPLNFITVHYTYFISVSLIASLIFWGSSRPSQSISYTDSLFLVVSAMTEAGLNTVNLSQMTLFQQIVLWVLIQMGSSILVSISTVLIRKRVFERRFEGVVRRAKAAGRMGRRSMSWGRSPDGARTRSRRSMSWGRNLDLVNTNRNGAVVLDDLDGATRGPEEQHIGPEKIVTAGSDETATVGEQAIVAPGTMLEKLDYPVETSFSSTSAKHGETDRIAPSLTYAPSPSLPHPRMLNFVGVGAHSNSISARRSISNVDQAGLRHRGAVAGHEDEAGLETSHYPSYLTRHTTGRNAQFHGLTKVERDHLGGVEYRAITLLSWIVPAYFVLWQLLGCVGLGAYMATKRPDVSRENGINPWWLGIFNGASAFNNSGMSLLDANMIPFQKSVYTLFTMGLLILAGNTAYPLFLRLIISTMLRLLCFLFPSPSAHATHKATLRFILTYPRRVYTNLFPRTPTFWLLFVIILLNGIDWVAFELLNIGNPATKDIPANYRALDGLFQALAVRSGGFYVIAITSLRIGLQVLYVIMMYISVYPVVITMRNSNVYEERSLGIYADDVTDKHIPSPNPDIELGTATGAAGPRLGTLRGRFQRSISKTVHGLPFSHALTMNGNPTPKPHDSNREFVRQQIHGQLAHDLWLLVIAVFAISCIEVSSFNADPVTFSVFNIMFEVVSGYGCVGISTGLPNQAYSFSGAWSKPSKLILCAVMLRGRHRGLPVALDRAVRLPDERAWNEEREEDHFTQHQAPFSSPRS